MNRLLLTLLVAFLCSFSSSAQETAYVEGELIIMLHDNHKPDLILQEFETINGTFTELSLNRELSKLSNIQLFEFDEDAVNDKNLLDEIRKHPAVRAAQFNHLVTERALPNDPGIGNQWHHVDGSDNDIDSDLAWDITTGGTTVNGDEIVVCIIEGGGSNYNHTDLIDNHWTNTAEIDGNGVDDDGNGYIDDVNGWNPPGNNDNIGAGGHGTAVSGMVGAKGDNNNGGAGVNWDVKLMQVTVGSLNEANVIASYAYPHTMRDLYNTSGGAQGAFVVATNASWGIDNANPANYPVWCAYYDDLGADGILNCGATANNNVNIDVVGDMPTGCSSDYMIAVTATNSSDVRTFSGYGINTIDLGAPGESVYLPSGSNAYSNTSGTSFASPCVAGAIALMYSAPCSDIASLSLTNPQLAADQMRDHLFNGVDPVANLATEVATGGRLNVRNSIDLILGNCGPLPPCDPVDLTLSSDCYINGAGAVEAEITVDVTMSEAFCSVETVCYAVSGGTFTCDDLVGAGITLDNLNTYSIQGLLSNTTYDVYYTTADGTSATQSITTPDCASEVPGCTDSGADNYDSAATIDDGSCTYPCENVTLTIDTDCWGGEVSWEIIEDATGAVVASVAGGTYGNQATFTWSDCLDSGCYTFNIYDSFGDGLDGTASGCAVDGNYIMVSDDLGLTIFQMGDPNYGDGTTHNFCLPSANFDGCTDPAACNYDATANNDDGSCTYPGCIDAAACNYDSTAGCDDGSCDLPDWQLPLVVGDGPAVLDCAPPAGYYTAEDQGCVQSVVDGDPFCVDTNWDQICQDAYMTCIYGCPNPQWQIPLTNGGGPAVFACDPPAGYETASNQFCAEQTVDADPFCVDTNWDGICDNAYIACDSGCTDPIACNYDSNAGTDDGSCDYSCAGCTDSTACNYNSQATQDDGSCVYPDACGVCGGTGTVPGCIDSTACNFDSTADCDDGSCLYDDVCGVCGGTATEAGCTDPMACNFSITADCDDGSCTYPDACGVCGGTATVAGCTDPTACNYNSLADCDDGSCTQPDACGNCGGGGLIPGCTDPTACNFNPIFDCDDGSCLYPDACGVCGGSGTAAGCTDAAACNYDSTADCDDGSCDYDSCSCPTDLNNDGFVDVADLLMFLANFGCSSGCIADFDGDGVVNSNDLLLFLPGFGNPCP